MKDLYDNLYGYIGTCEPDGQGFRGHLIGVEPAVEYRGATLEKLKIAREKAVAAYLKRYSKAGIKPATPPEPFFTAAGRDVAWLADVRRDPQVRVLAYYSRYEVFLRSRDHNETARTMSSWCPLTLQRYSDNFGVVQDVMSFLDRYGWHPCPGWENGYFPRPDY